MKLKLSELRRLIREAVDDIVAPRRHATKSNPLLKSIPGEIIKSGNMQDFLAPEEPGEEEVMARQLIKQNKKTWERIVRHGPIVFLGDGRIGAAFRVGQDYVLKLQGGDSPVGAFMADALRGGGPTAPYVPNIIGHGKMSLYGAEMMEWILMERLETDFGSMKPTLEHLLEDLVEAAHAGTVQLAAKEMIADRKHELDAISSGLSLDDSAARGGAPAWFVHLVEAVRVLVAAGEETDDLHAENLGIRRSTGLFAFFDI